MAFGFYGLLTVMSVIFSIMHHIYFSLALKILFQMNTDGANTVDLENRSTNTKTFVEITIVGEDKKGIVADITKYIFKNGGNIEKINQNVVKGLFGMHLEASFQKISKSKVKKELADLSDRLKMEIKIHFHEENKIKNVAIFVSKEDHCLLKILNSVSKGEIVSNISIIIGSDEKLKSIANSYHIPFFYIDHVNHIEAENRILQLVDQFDVDLIVLAEIYANIDA